MKIYVTGCVGFIGFNLCYSLLKNKKNKVIGIDKASKSQSKLVKSKFQILSSFNNFEYFKVDISNSQLLEKVFIKQKPDIVIHLAAEAGVRKSITNPKIFLDANIVGFFNLIELIKKYKVKNLYFASSSSVYGDSHKYPTFESLNTDFPLSLYGATKKCNEVIAYSYSYLYKINIVGFRFFTVYGPYGRVDMAIHKFFEKIINKKPINLFNHGNHSRDFTFIKDVVDDIVNIIRLKKNSKKSFEIYNIGGGHKLNINDLIKKIEFFTNKKAKIVKKSLQQGDPLITYCDNSKISKLTKRKKYTQIDEGLSIFYNWYKKFYKINL